MEPRHARRRTGDGGRGGGEEEEEEEEEGIPSPCALVWSRAIRREDFHHTNKIEIEPSYFLVADVFLFFSFYFYVA